MKTNAHVYVMDGGNGVLKIGHSKQPSVRAEALGGVIVLHATDVLEQAEKIERLAHKLLKLDRKHHRGEWFNVTLDEAIATIDRAIRIADGTENMPVRDSDRPHLFTIRADDELWAAIDLIRSATMPIRDRSTAVKELIYKEVARIQKGRK